MNTTLWIALAFAVPVLIIFLLCLVRMAKQENDVEDFRDATLTSEWPEVAPYKVEPPSEGISKHLHASGGLMVTREGINHIAPYKVKPPSCAASGNCE